MEKRLPGCMNQWFKHAAIGEQRGGRTLALTELGVGNAPGREPLGKEDPGGM